MTTQGHYSISNRSTGADFGTFEAGSEVDALATMHREAGYDVAVREDGAELVFASDADRDLCGDVDAWIVRRVA